MKELLYHDSQNPETSDRLGKIRSNKELNNVFTEHSLSDDYTCRSSIKKLDRFGLEKKSKIE